jgi:hypothetical protein
MRCAPVLRKRPVDLFRRVHSRVESLLARYGIGGSGKRRKPFYPTLQDGAGAPTDDLDSPDSFSPAGAPPELNRSDFYNWGSE